MFSRALLRSLLMLLTLSFLQAGKVPSDVCTIDGNKVTDKATGIVFPQSKSFSFSRKGYSLLGAGVRAKSLYVAEVNVYSVGLYVDGSMAKTLLNKFKGKAAEEIAKDKSFYDSLVNSKGLDQILYLKFARGVAAEKVVDALTAVENVDPSTVSTFSSMLLKSIGKNIGKGDTITLGIIGDGSVKVEVRDKSTGVVKSPQLGKSLLKLYMGSKPVSEAAKTGFATLVPNLF